MTAKWIGFTALLAALLGTFPLQAAPEAAEAVCEAATPMPNPWSRGLPSGWWQNRHEEIMALPNRDQCQLVFVGDSITDGWTTNYVSGGDLWNQNFAPYNAINLGIVCDSTQHALWKIRNGEVDGMPNLKVAVIALGVNNKGICLHTDADVEKGIIAVYDALKQKVPGIRCIVMGVFPRYLGWDMSAEINANLAKHDDGKQFFFVDIGEKLEQTEGAIADHVGHITPKGYQIWADAIREPLRHLLADDITAWAATRVPSTPARAIVSGRGFLASTWNRTAVAADQPQTGAPMPYRKWFGLKVWGTRSERRKATLMFLGSIKTRDFPAAVWDREYAGLNAYKAGPPHGIDTTRQILWRLDNGVIDKTCTNLQVVVVEAGVENGENDKPEEIAAAFKGICERIQAVTPQAKIVLMGLFPGGPAGDAHHDVNQRIAKLADGKQIFYLDINPALLKTPGTVDGKWGLSERGYAIWAEQLRPLLKRLM